MNQKTTDSSLADFIAQARRPKTQQDLAAMERRDREIAHAAASMDPTQWQDLHGTERQRAYKREWRKANRERINALHRENGYYRRRTERARQRRQTDPEYAAMMREQWRRHNQRTKQRMQADPEYRARIRAQQKAARQRHKQRKQQQQQEEQPWHPSTLARPSQTRRTLDTNRLLL